MITQCKHHTGDALSAYSSGRNGSDLKHTVLVTHERADSVHSEVIVMQQVARSRSGPGG